VPVCAMRPAYAGKNRLAPDFVLPSSQGFKTRQIRQDVLIFGDGISRDRLASVVQK